MWWKAREGEYHRLITVKPSSFVSNAGCEEVGYGLFAACDFQAGQTVVIFIGVP